MSRISESRNVPHCKFFIENVRNYGKNMLVLIFFFFKSLYSLIYQWCLETLKKAFLYVSFCLEIRRFIIKTSIAPLQLHFSCKRFSHHWNLIIDSFLHLVLNLRQANNIFDILIYCYCLPKLICGVNVIDGICNLLIWKIHLKFWWFELSISPFIFIRYSANGKKSSQLLFIEEVRW